MIEWIFRLEGGHCLQQMSINNLARKFRRGSTGIFDLISCNTPCTEFLSKQAIREGVWQLCARRASGR
jgi:hypothetical protein